MKFNYVLIRSDKTPNKATTKTQSDVATTTRCQKTKSDKEKKHCDKQKLAATRRERERDEVR